MILVSPATGSKQYLQLLRDRGLRAEFENLESADVAFVGDGPQDTPTMVGVEIKKLGDLLRCIADNRFAGHQLPLLQEGFGAAWLLVEGIWKANGGGLLVEWRGGQWHHIKWGRRAWHATDVEHWLMTQEIKGGMRIRFSPGEAETARWIHALWSWWTAAPKGWESHRSHLAVYDRPMVERVATSKPSPTAKLIRALPGVDEKARQVAREMQQVPCPKLCEWSVADWAKALGVKGKSSKAAERVWGVLHGGLHGGPEGVASGRRSAQAKVPEPRR